jgi:hypothetical protein
VLEEFESFTMADMGDERYSPMRLWSDDVRVKQTCDIPADVFMNRCKAYCALRTGYSADELRAPQNIKLNFGELLRKAKVDVERAGKQSWYLRACELYNRSLTQ